MESVEVSYSGEGKNSQNLSFQDSKLITTNIINTSFGQNGDYIELFIYGENGDLLEKDYDASDYYPSILNNPQNNTFSTLVLDPEKDLRNRGFSRGNLNVQYNFYKRLFSSAFGRYYWIKQISPSRTEIKLASQVLSDGVISAGYEQYRAFASSVNYYPVFYLNFGDNQIQMASNALYGEDEQGGYILIKLYEPLPPEYGLKTELWLVEKVAESVSYDVSISIEADEVVDVNSLRGPNFNVKLNTKSGQTTPYYNYNNLILSPVSSSYQKLKSFYQDKSIDINIDYSDFSNFVHFSSAVQRVNNFVYKLQQIEASNAIIADQLLIAGGSIVSSSITAEQKFIDRIIDNFDIYEYFLYFNSSSWAWPKSNSTQPYQLYSVTSSQALNFLGSETTVPTPATASILFSASYYDSTNKDILRNSSPQYILDDPSNQPYVTFLDMIGQHFDNIWVYYKDVSTRYDATNNPNTGISLDLVSDALRGLGMQLYTNTNVSDNLYYTLFGINPDGSLLPPTGSEWITNYVTSSLATLPSEQIQDEVYKRLYHNLPYLLKTKGTARGVKSLITSYGIPESMLKVREFGGNVYNQLDGVLDVDTSDNKISIATGSYSVPPYLITEILEYITAENDEFLVGDEPIYPGSVTGSLSISSSLLSPYTTVQYYLGNTRLNSTNVEVGFSPSDTVNSNIISSSGLFVIDQLIGSPGYRYSSSYAPLVSASNAYFSSYTQPSSVWEYIRLLKFYNNSLFKIIKDFVPARANVSTGIIVKSHLYERNKYARHEPEITFNDYSQSIDLLEVSADNGGALTGSTAWSGFLVTPLGLASYNSTDGIELFNGELSGSEIVITNGDALEQREYSSTITGSYGNFVQLGALYQNITSSVRSEILIDLDYSANQSIPVNYGAVTYSLNQSTINNYAAYTNLNNPFAQVQDYNYSLKRSIIPRYSGSFVSSQTYNTYTDGDVSYGKTAAIDKIKYQYAYLIDIYSASVFLPNRSNAQIKYIIDNNQNVLDLTKANKNIFEIQNIYKSGEYADISLFEYDEANPYTQQLADNPTVTIYEGGFRYLPILHNLSGSAQRSQSFNLTVTEETIVPAGSAAQPGDPELQSSNYTLSWWSVEVEGFDDSDYYLFVSASYNLASMNYNTIVTANVYYPDNSGVCAATPLVRTINVSSATKNGVSSTSARRSNQPSTGNGSGGSVAGGDHWPPGFSTNCALSITSVSPPTGSTTSADSTYYTTEFSSSQCCIYYLTASNEIVFNSTMSYYYDNPPIFRSDSDSSWLGSGLDPVILPFQLEIGDRVSFFNSNQLGWDERFEYLIKSGPRYIGNNQVITGSVIAFELDRSVNLALLSSGSSVPVENISGAPYRSCKYIVWKHVPDETNVILSYNPKDPTLVENGILFPEYIDRTVRDNAGNVIKALKQQNLI